jgi:hypothetical protein
MQEDRLRKLLEGAEAGATSPFVPGDLATRVRQRRQQRVRNRQRLAIAAPLLLAAALVGVWRLAPPRVEPIAERTETKTAGVDLAAELAAIEQLQAEAELHGHLARQLAAERRVALAAKGAARQPVESVSEQVEIVAYRMILTADTLRSAMRQADEAGVYEKLIQLFPHTHSAELARERLLALGDSQGAT